MTPTTQKTEHEIDLGTWINGRTAAERVAGVLAYAISEVGIGRKLDGYHVEIRGSDHTHADAPFDLYLCCNRRPAQAVVEKVEMLAAGVAAMSRARF